MPLKVWTANGMKRLTRHQMITFVGGVKKRIPKGITFINGEKKVLWQVGELEFNSWTFPELQYPYSTTVNTRFRVLEADENKVVYNVERYTNRANVTNISAPYNENSVDYGAVTYRYADTDNTKARFEANKRDSSASRVGTTTIVTTTLTVNEVDVARSDLAVTSSQIEQTSVTTSYSSGGGTSVSTSDTSLNYIPDLLRMGETYKEVQIVKGSGKYIIQKTFVMGTGAQTVCEISSNGYSGTAKPTVWCYAKYNDRYLYIGTQYQSTSGGDYIYRLVRVDMTNGSVSILLNNLTSPVTAIIVDGSYLIVSAENKLYKMGTAGSISNTYTSTNTLPTLIGKCGDYYYVTTTRTDDYMNIEVVDASTFTLFETKQLGIKMINTISMPYITQNDYLCFGTQYYTTTQTVVSGGGVVIPSGRQASIRVNSGGGTITTYDNVELRVCRIKCY